MKINPIYKLRKVAGESIILQQGKDKNDLTKVIALNATSVFMWEHFFELDFTAEEVAQFLFDNYEVEMQVATQDAQNWVNTLKENGLVIE